jgi:hypothetical protein
MAVTFGAMEERGFAPLRPRVACVSACSPGKFGSAGNDDAGIAFDALGVAVAVAVGVAVVLAIVGAAASAGADAVGAGAATGGFATEVVAHRLEEEHPEATSESPSAQMKRW